MRPDTVEQNIRAIAQRIDPSYPRRFMDAQQAKMDQLLKAKAASRLSPFFQKLGLPGFFFKKPDQMGQVETNLALPGEDITDLFGRMYWQEKMSVNDIANTLNMNHSTIRTWMVHFGIPTKSMKVAARHFYDNPDKKAMKLAKSHTPESNTKRSESGKKRYNRDPHPYLKAAAKGRQVLNEKWDKYSKSIFGDNPQETLYQLLVIQRLTYQEAATRLDTSIGTVQNEAKKHRVIVGQKKVGTTVIKRQSAQQVAELREKLEDFTGLNEQEQQVLGLLYPPNIPPRTQAEVASLIKRTRARVDQIEKAALWKLHQRAVQLEPNIEVVNMP